VRGLIFFASQQLDIDMRALELDLEATALYDLIENDIAPRFYDVDHDGVPLRWIEMVRHTLKTLGPKVGERVPEFSLSDQAGVTRSLRSSFGPKGAVAATRTGRPGRAADWQALQVVAIAASRCSLYFGSISSS